MLLGMYPNAPEEQNFQHSAKQTYIALGIALLAAAELEVDATPMEGFDAKALDVLLNLNDKGLRSTVILPIGYRDTENDWLVNMKKIRKSKSQLISEIK